mgnify:CR=1 FL=1|jgi:hypothetical protein
MILVWYTWIEIRNTLILKSILNLKQNINTTWITELDSIITYC